MSGDDAFKGSRTVFRPSPLQGHLQPGGQPAAPPSGFSESGYTRPPGAGEPPPLQPGGLSPSARLAQDDVPLPAQPQDVRNRLLAEAGPILALAASVRSGRARMPMPRLHSAASEAIASFDRAIGGFYPDETRQRAKYALCATLDDIAQNLPGAGNDAAEWARRSMVVQTFRENIGGDRFWQLVDEMLARPAQNLDLIELFHACLAAGFEGRFRVMPDGKRRLHEIMQQLYGALEHTRTLSTAELSRHWRGETAPQVKVGFWSRILLVAAIAGVVLLLIYIVLRLLLLSSGSASWDALSGLTPAQPVSLAREGGPPPAAPPSQQADQLRQFLAPEIAAKQVVVDQDARTVRVRTTIGELFRPASDALEPGREALFRRIAEAVEREPGGVTIEGHADADRVSSLAFSDNLALSAARANTVAQLFAGVLSDPGRIEAKGFGDGQPIASNETSDGKAQNRRVEIVIPRRQ